jgi:hypothetical protein
MKSFTEQELTYAKDNPPWERKALLFNGCIREELEVLIDALENLNATVDQKHEDAKNMCLDTLRYRLAGQYIVMDNERGNQST